MRSIILPFLLLFFIAACQNAPEPTAPIDTPMTVSVDSAEAPTAKLNLNTATGDEFRTIPGVGDRMVHEFEEYRPYVSIQQFRREIGKYVDEAQVAAYEQYVFVPVDPNESDAETLQQLPGVDATEAGEIIAGRPFASHEAFLDGLASYTDTDRAALAAYLEAP